MIWLLYLKENNQAETDSNDGASSCYESAAEDISDAGSGGTNSENDSEHADQENTEDSQGQTKKESKRIGSSKKKKKKKQQRKLQNQVNLSLSFPDFILLFLWYLIIKISVNSWQTYRAKNCFLFS